MQRSILALGLAAGCGSAPPHVEVQPPPPKMTTGTLAGALCHGDTCACRSGPEDGGAGYPDPGKKRFEIRLASAYDLWVTLPHTVLYKSPERTDACFYVDLAPGKTPVLLRASHPDGVSFALEIHELGAQTHSWYDTFRFNCGHPGVCSFDELADRKAELAQVVRGLHDKCGSTMIKGVAWDHGRSPDHAHPSELAIELTLDVYKFAPDKPAGGPGCRGD
jgi:hypothetical protein